VRNFIAVCALAALVPGWALAQEAAPQLEENPRAPRFNEVERGFFTSVEAGFLGLTKTPVADRSAHPYACVGVAASAECSGGFGSGLALSVDLGYDFTSRLAGALFLLQAFESASQSYGSFQLTATGAELRWAFAGSTDVNGVERFFAYVRGRGAYAWTYPKGLFGTTDVFAGAGVGIDYYTRLRHFSVGLAVDGLYFFQANVPAFDVLATLRYTF
jgi:hypothetical protein